MAGRKPISLALQGGGALGAFTWGVLDRLLEEDRVVIAAISGASAGAMNAVVLADGLAQGGKDGARRSLEAFWKGVAEAGHASSYRAAPLALFLSAVAPAFPAWADWARASLRMSSPYDLNPLNINPLREVVEELVDFERVRACRELELFIAATNVETGRIKIFRRQELTSAHVMASACLPHLFQAVEVDGAPYWDGGYMGNPALFPLFDVKDTADIVIVEVLRQRRRGAPRTAAEIAARIDEITFNASLQRELRAIEFVRRLLAEQRLDPGRYRMINVHRIEDAKALDDVGADTLPPQWPALEGLQHRGRAACERWLSRHWADIGVRPTVDLRALYEGDPEFTES